MLVVLLACVYEHHHALIGTDVDLNECIDGLIFVDSWRLVLNSPTTASTLCTPLRLQDMDSLLCLLRVT